MSFSPQFLHPPAPRAFAPGAEGTGIKRFEFAYEDPELLGRGLDLRFALFVGGYGAKGDRGDQTSEPEDVHTLSTDCRS
jgi:hypothetical protein